MQSSRFQFQVEAEAFEKSGVPEERERRIGGFVSTEDMDRQSEILLQKGLDFSEFLQRGWFNDNHDKTTGMAVGYPEMAELRPTPQGSEGWYVEGYLLKGHPPADNIWTMAKSLQRSNGARKLGFSVEGSILERDRQQPNVVKKALVREVAVTRCPINGQTGLDVLAKSLSVGHGAPAGGETGDGSPLRVQSLEGQGSDDEKEREKEKLRKKRMKKSEAVDFLMERHPTMTRDFATRVIEYAMRHFAV